MPRPGVRLAGVRLAGALLAAALLLSSTLWPAPAAAAVSIRDDRGTTHVFIEPPARIVSLLPSLTEAVCALGACSRLVGIDRYANSPPQVTTLPRLGGLDDTPIERLVALRPDVVLAAPSSRVVDRLRALGQRVVVLDSRTHDDVRSSLARLAQLLGDPARGDALWSRIQAQLDEAARRVPPAMRGRRVYFEVESAPYAAGPASFVGQTLTRLGLGNIVPADMGPFPKLNPEFVVRAQPDLIVAAQRNLAAMRERPGWSSLAALREQRTCAFDTARYELLIRPGPRLGEAALELADCLAALGRR